MPNLIPPTKPKRMPRFMHQAILLLFFLSVTLPLAAQRSGKVTVTWGDEHKKAKKDGVEAMYLAGDGGIYLQRKKSIFNIQAFPIANLEYFEASMKRKATRDVDLKYEKRDRSAKGIVSVEEKEYLFTTLYNKGTKNQDMFVQELGGSRVRSLESIRRVAEMPGDHTTVRGRYDIKISDDGSHLLVFSKLPRHLKAPDAYAFRVFNQNMSLVWELDAELPYEADQFTVTSHQVDNDGNVYILGKYVDERTKGAFKFVKSFQYILLAYKTNSKTPEIYTLDSEDKHITSLGFRTSPEGDLIFAGFYSDASARGGGIKGTFYARIDPFEGRIDQRNFKPFDFQFITEGYSNWQLRRAEKAESDENKQGPELTQYVFRELIQNDDGSVTLIAEQHYVITHGDQQSRVTTYYYNDIIIVCMDAEGNIRWNSRIPKLQQTDNDQGRFSSFALGVRNNRLFFAYNDHHVNHQAGSKPANRRPFRGKNSVLVISEVLPDGSIKEYTVGDIAKGKGKYRMEPAKSIQTSDNTVAVYTSRKTRYKFGRINLPD
jgi:hypothetical protein